MKTKQIWQNERAVLCDDGWSFCLTDREDPGENPEGTLPWEAVRLPHDWSTEYPVDRKAPSAGAGGYARCGIGWYRRTFSLPEEPGTWYLLCFEGVYMDARVYVNGTLRASHIYGYTPFAVPLEMENGRAEVLVVVNNERQPGSRWYTGSGITRHVWLEMVRDVHLAMYGIQARSSRHETQAGILWSLGIGLLLVRRGKEESGQTFRLEAALLAEDGKETAENSELFSPAWKAEDQETALQDGCDAPERDAYVSRMTMELDCPGVREWSVEDPVLYDLRIRLFLGSTLLEERHVPFGFRTAVFTPEKGFLLNGRQVKLRGVCLHNDAGCVGAAVPAAVWKRRLLRLRDMGVNAVRLSHNPADPDLLDLLDRMGFLVMEEAFDEWEIRKVKEIPHPEIPSRGYAEVFDSCWKSDLAVMLLRDRNRPSVVIWSIGNEIREQVTPRGAELAEKLAKVCHRLDPGRPVTAGNDLIHAEPKRTADAFDAALDVVGYNYPGRWRRYTELFYTPDHIRHPDWCMIGTERPSGGYTRGDYSRHAGDPYRIPYDSAPVETGKLLRYTESHDFVSGDFMWTGIDYLGECSWPDRAASFGCLDTAGFPKDMFYFYKSVWNRKEPFAYLCPHWNLDVQEGTVVPVLCYTTCHEAELFVNGVSYGRKAKLFPDYGMTMEYGHFDTVRGFPTTDDLFLSWDVPYQPGTLEAAGFEEGREVCRCRVVTAGRPAALSLLADRKELLADGRDIVQVELSLLDAAGNPVPDADVPVEIRVSGEGELLGADSGRPDSHIPWKSTHQETFGGKLLVVLRAGTKKGILSLAVQAGDLSAEVSIPVVDG